MMVRNCIFIFLLAFFFLGACEDHTAEAPKDLAGTDELCQLFIDEKQKLTEKISSQDNYWPLPEDCDGMIWAGKAAVVLDDVDIQAAEYPDHPGKYGRRPPIDDNWCWMPDEGDLGSKTEWSRDMGIAGLFPWIWKRNKLKIAEDHAEYGFDHFWKMGEPIDNGRVLYTPGMFGLLYQMIYALGGDNNVLRHTPDVYRGGQEDYHGHLQVMKIWLRGEVEAVLDENKLALGISGTMLKRLEEHAEREPRNPLYAFVLGIYTGEFQTAIDLLLDPEKPVGPYVRCKSDPDACVLAERVFVMYLLLEKLGKI